MIGVVDGVAVGAIDFLKVTEFVFGCDVVLDVNRLDK
jgi:hypothetical protein